MPFTQTQLAQLLMVGFHGPEPGAEAWRFMEETPPGGVLLFKHNIASQQQVADVLVRIQERCAQAGQPPLLVGIDQEGGRVVRLTDEVDFPTFPSARALAGDPEPEQAVGQAASVTAEGLRKLGIQMNFAPVMDVVTDPDNRVIGDRSFGADPAVVERLGLIAIAAMQERGVAATAKHFPGHGPTATDSHLDLPVIALSREELKAVHLRPFRAAVDAGVAAVMTAHAVYPAFDADAPATLSHAILTGTLRDAWGYDGVIITDSMTMQAIARRHTVPRACVRAIQAGADILLIPASPALHRECLQALTDAANSGEIPGERLAQSLQRVIQLRRNYQ